MGWDGRLLRAILAAFALWAGLAVAADTVPDNVGIVGKFQRPPNVKGTCGFLNVTQVPQGRNLCVPASASAAIRYYGESISQFEIKTLSRGQVYDPKKEFTDHTITLFKDLLKGLKTRGYDWKNLGYPTTDKGFDDGIKKITSEIDKRHPVLVDTSLYGAHTFLVVGYSSTHKALYVVDPNVPAPGYRILTHEQFKAIWDSKKVGFDVRALVTTAPKSARKP